MAGFFNNVNRSFQNNNISDFLKELSTLGVSNKIEILKNSQSVGYSEMNNNTMNFTNDLDEYEYLNIISSENSKYLPFSQLNYIDRRQEFRELSKEGEIEKILTILSDETIVYDDNNKFCEVTELSEELKNRDSLQKQLESNFKKIYHLFNFNDPTTGWWLFYKFLVDGFLSFEIVYNESQTEIIGFKEIDPLTLERKVTNEGDLVWCQNSGNGGTERVLDDTQVIYISYASSLIDSHVSYIARLVKPYNLLQVMEQTRTTWAVVNSSFRMKFVIPVNGKSRTQAKQTLRKLMNSYNEELTYDNTSGQYKVNGKPHLPGMKQIWIPSKDGTSPEIETIGGDGPDLSDTEALRYFRTKLEDISKIPNSRFAEDSGEMFDNNSSITQDEAGFNRFIIRLRSIFKEILLKPLWIQMALDNPKLKMDANFKSMINIRFNKYNIFEELKEMEIETRKIEHISGLMDLEDADGEPYFAMEFLLKKYNVFPEEELRENERLKKKLLSDKENNDEEDIDDEEDINDEEEDTTSDNNNDDDTTDSAIADTDL